MHVHQFRAMNSDIVLMADGHPSSVLEGFEPVRLRRCSRRRAERRRDHPPAARAKEFAAAFAGLFIAVPSSTCTASAICRATCLTAVT